jgi:SAM-dependent methyltransferase
MHNASMISMRQIVEDYDLADGKIVVDVGSYDYNGTYRPLFPGSRYIGADITAGPNVDVIVGSKEWNALRDVDAVISGQTFEHVEDDAGLLEQIQPILKPGGLLCVITPSTGPVHDAPKWYRHYTADSLSGIVRGVGFEVLYCTIDPGAEFHDVCCVARKAGRKKGMYK